MPATLQVSRVRTAEPLWFGGREVPFALAHWEDAAALQRLAALILEREPALKAKYPEAWVDGANAIRNSLTGRYYAYNLLEWDDPAIRALRAFFLESVQALLAALPLLHRPALFIQCWANTVREGEFIEPHNHGDAVSSYISGNMAVQVAEPTQSATFYSLTGERGRQEPRHAIANLPGNLTLFPSAVYHYTDPWPHREPRITVAFDLATAEVAERQRRYRVGRRYLPLF